MAKSSNNYSILVGVQLDTANIQSQLNAYAKNLKFKLEFADGDSISGGLGTINKKLKETAEVTDGANKKTKEFNDSLKNTNKTAQDTALTFQAANEVFQTSIEIIGSMVEQVFELNDAMIEFQKVSDLTGEALEDYVAELSDIGNTVGRTGSEMVEAATSFRKNGFNDEDAAQLAEVAAMYQNISDEAISAADSSDFIIAQLVAFGDSLTDYNTEAEKATHIINSVNEVSNSFAVSSADLATSIGNVSSALSIGGNSFEEVLGLLTAGTEIVRNASKVSRGLVSVQSRYNQVIDETSSTGKALLEWYEKYNIEIFDQEGQLLSLYDTLGQVAEIWPTLTKNEQAYYLNQQAGKTMPLQGEYAGTYLELYIPNYNRNIMVA